eukprot:Skav229816  [mRNA]  locus=scaffold567:405072:405284:+ [translate_table: standard]
MFTAHHGFAYAQSNMPGFDKIGERKIDKIERLFARNAMAVVVLLLPCALAAPQAPIAVPSVDAARFHIHS